MKATTLDSIVKEQIEPDSIVDTDYSTSYTNFKNIVKEHRTKVISKEDIANVLLWVYLSNAKRILLDIYHDIKAEYLQNYLNKFCYKFNRKYFGENLFDRLLIALVSYKINLGIIFDNHLNQ